MNKVQWNLIYFSGAPIRALLTSTFTYNVVVSTERNGCLSFSGSVVECTSDNDWLGGCRYGGGPGFCVGGPGFCCGGEPGCGG